MSKNNNILETINEGKAQHDENGTEYIQHQEME